MPPLPPARRRSRAESRAGLEQPEADLIASDPWIETQDILGKRRELTDQFRANQSAADHDDCETPAPLRRVGGCVRAFEAFNQVASTRASAIVLNVSAFDEPGISPSLVDAPSATTRWS